MDAGEEAVFVEGGGHAKGPHRVHVRRHDRDAAGDESTKLGAAVMGAGVPWTYRYVCLELRKVISRNSSTSARD